MNTREAFHVVEQFERVLAEYAGAPHAIAVDCCTNALLIAVRRRFETEATGRARIPAHTYVGVAQSVRNAGLEFQLAENKWVGEYEIHPLRIWDSAKWLRRGMYRPGTLTCLSFQASKQLPIGRGGAILCDDEDDADWLRRASFDGRDRDMSLQRQKRFGWGIHAYMTPPDAARGLWLLSWLRGEQKPIGSWEDYPDLREKEWV